MFSHIFKPHNTVLVEAPTRFGPTQSDSEKAQLEFISPKKNVFTFCKCYFGFLFRGYVLQF